MKNKALFLSHAIGYGISFFQTYWIIREIKKGEAMKKDNEIREATVTRIIDGDTFVATVDLKYKTDRRDLTFRLLEVDTPERGKQGFEEATDFTADHILNKKIHIYNPNEAQDSFGRYLVKVFYEEDGKTKSLNKRLLVEHLAEKYED
jgi:micrococcal nuclease